MHLLPLVSHINVAAGGVGAADVVGAAGTACVTGVVCAAGAVYAAGGSFGAGTPAAEGVVGVAASGAPEAPATEDQATSATNVSIKPTKGRIDLGIPARTTNLSTLSILRTLGPIVNY